MGGGWHGQCCGFLLEPGWRRVTEPGSKDPREPSLAFELEAMGSTPQCRAVSGAAWRSGAAALLPRCPAALASSRPAVWSGHPLPPTRPAGAACSASPLCAPLPQTAQRSPLPRLPSQPRAMGMAGDALGSLPGWL